MPVYEYQAADADKSCEHCRDVFETQQSMRDEPLSLCPECGSPVKRVISKVSMSSAKSTKSMLSDKNLKEKGFSKLVNEGDGKFRKTV